MSHPWLQDLTTEATLGDLPSHEFTLSPDTPGDRVAAEFERRPDLPGVIVREGGADVVAMISRGLFFQRLSRPFSREIYLKRPLRMFMDGSLPEPLILPASHRIADAAVLALDRPMEHAYEPLVVRGSDGERRVKQTIDSPHRQRHHPPGATTNMADKETEPKSERSEKLPDEILQAQQGRADLLKWKLVIAATLGALGFGLTEKVPAEPLLLSLIPLCCLYVDLICHNLSIRQIMIGTYYATIRHDDYESFCALNRNTFGMEDWALWGSTYTVCGLLVVVGAFTAHGSLRTPADVFPWLRLNYQSCSIVVSAAVGIGLSWKIARARDQSLSNLKKLQAARNQRIQALTRSSYTLSELAAIHSYLDEQGCFMFRTLHNGLFPAAEADAASGYQNVWVRDNIHIANAHLICGDVASASRNVSTLLQYFQKYQSRFRNAIENGKPADPMDRPNIRFDGETLTELTQKWPHAQNDALGYFLWLYCKLAQHGIVACDEAALKCVAEFPRYFDAIEYWDDPDSGHWEEERKVSASSIGTVVAGLREFEILAIKKSLWSDPAFAKNLPAVTPHLIEKLRLHGQTALDQILPCESIKPETRYRRYDAALLFLIYPLNVVTGEQADEILRDVTAHLQGAYGIRRYLGDSYWFPDYKEKYPADLRTSDSTEAKNVRNSHVRVGEEAQWCIFDSIISAIHGQRYLAYKQQGAADKGEESLKLQTHFLNRALGQVTGAATDWPECRVPEAYYLHHGQYVPNDHTPLYWAQANLWLALHGMEQSLSMG